MAKNFDDRAMDIRSLQLNINRGNVTAKEYNDFLKSLPDLSEQLEEIPAYEEPKPEEEILSVTDNLTFSVD